MEGSDVLPEDLVLSFSDVTQAVVQHVKNVLQPPASQPRLLIPFFSSSGGCNDAFSGFGFLAFLLALLDLILELQDNDGDDGGRSVRDLGARGGNSTSSPGLFPFSLEESRVEGQRGEVACYSMLRGFLNALAASDAACAERFLCEGAQEAAATGALGQVIANVASMNAAGWLVKENATRYKGVSLAGLAGARGESCDTKYSECYDLPPSYSYPSVSKGDPLKDDPK